MAFASCFEVITALRFRSIHTHRPEGNLSIRLPPRYPQGRRSARYSLTVKIKGEIGPALERSEVLHKSSTARTGGVRFGNTRVRHCLIPIPAIPRTPPGQMNQLDSRTCSHVPRGSQKKQQTTSLCS